MLCRQYGPAAQLSSSVRSSAIHPCTVPVGKSRHVTGSIHAVRRLEELVTAMLPSESRSSPLYDIGRRLDADTDHHKVRGNSLTAFQQNSFHFFRAFESCNLFLEPELHSVGFVQLLE